MLRRLWFSVRLQFARWWCKKNSVPVRIRDGDTGHLVMQLPCELVVFQLRYFAERGTWEIVCDLPVAPWPPRCKPKDLGSLTWLSKSRAILRVNAGAGTSNYGNVVVTDVFSALGGKYFHECSAASRAEQVERLCFTLEQA